jgi:hypothetical protein
MNDMMVYRQSNKIVSNTYTKKLYWFGLIPSNRYEVIIDGINKGRDFKIFNDKSSEFVYEVFGNLYYCKNNRIYSLGNIFHRSELDEKKDKELIIIINMLQKHTLKIKEKRSIIDFKMDLLVNFLDNFNKFRRSVLNVFIKCILR